MEMALQIADQDAMEAYQGNAKRLSATFFLEAVEDPDESAKQGRPIFREEEWVRIMVPGDKDNIVVRNVRQIDKELYPAQYAAFKNRQEQPVVGTPLDQIPFLSKPRVMEFQALGLKTAEQVRDMSDTIAAKFMDAHGIRKRVAAFLVAAADGAPTEKLQAELAERDAKIAQLMQAIESQGEKIEQLTKSQRR
jgi:hypothetical protein